MCSPVRRQRPHSRSLRGLPKPPDLARSATLARAAAPATWRARPPQVSVRSKDRAMVLVPAQEEVSVRLVDLTLEPPVVCAVEAVAEQWRRLDSWQRMRRPSRLLQVRKRYLNQTKTKNQLKSYPSRGPNIPMRHEKCASKAKSYFASCSHR